MTTKRYFFVLCGAFSLVIILIVAGTAGGNYILHEQSKKLTNLKVESKILDSQQTAVLQAKKDIDKYTELDSIAKSIVPQDKDQAKTVREIIKIAAENGIPIKSVSFDSSTLGAPVAAAPATGAAGAATKPVDTSATSQLKPVVGIKDVYSLQIQVASSSSVKYQNLLNFLNGLENNRRTAHVTAISINPDGKNRNLLDFNLTLTAYVKP